MNINTFNNITSDSRKVTPGTLFIAVKGYNADGHAYIPQALKSGASAVVYEDEEMVRELVDKNPDVEWIRVDNSRRAVAEIADEFFGHPSRNLKLVGVTGTNGKTTTVTLLYNLFTRMGYKCGLLSTIANYVAGKRFPAINTTCDPITINALMRQMVDEGCEYCFMEVSSIGAQQDRVHALDFNVGIFSNLTHDHLDYHKTFAEYIRCKKLFFDSLPGNATAIINIDDKNGKVMVQNTKAKVMTYSCRTLADHSCKLLEMSMTGMLLKIDGTEVWVPLIGQHNAYNALAIYSVAIALGVGKEEALIGLSDVGQVKGRLEVLHGPDDISVIIDYAHTPDALENALKAIRGFCRQKTLICLFGCGGNRDKTKRSEMGAIASDMADKAIITSDNPRFEDPVSIIEQIKEGVDKKNLHKVLCITDRKEAIRTAILTAPVGGIILLAGKGHEDYQIFGDNKTHFDEREVVEQTFGEKKQ